jgi:hypothetical protein
VQLASSEVMSHSSSFTGLPQYVSFIWGKGAACTLPISLAWRIFTCELFWLTMDRRPDAWL